MRWIGAVGKVIETFEWPRSRSFFDQYFHRPFANIFDTAQSIAHSMFPMRIGLYGKFGFT